jgi:energy-coupling factor transporter transmembrane protein EcfT
MPFIRDSSILNPEPIASFLLFLGFIFVVIFNVNIVLTVIYVIFRIVKKIKKSE